MKEKMINKNLLKFIFNVIINLIILSKSLDIFAVRESRPISTDSRLRVITYAPDEVFKFTGYYGFQSCIQLAKNEEVVSISMGDTTGWQIVPTGYRIFLKPMELDATTNMTLITNKRTYFFELYAQEAEDIRDPDLVFNMKFLYPDEEDEDNILHYNQSNMRGPDLSEPEKYNFNYTVSGDHNISPVKIFDDGELTYFQFRDVNAELPSIFGVDKYGREFKVNYQLSKEVPNLIIIDEVLPKFAIRADKEVLCVFNEGYGD